MENAYPDFRYWSEKADSLMVRGPRSRINKGRRCSGVAVVET
jgi:hypothetical protein